MPPQEEPPAIRHLEDSHTPEAVRSRLTGDVAGDGLKDFIYGAIDGAVTTFAIVAGVAGAGLASGVIIVLGLANLLADGFSMAVSNFLGTRAEEQGRERIRREEEHHIEHYPEGEREEIRQIFAGKGFSGDDLEHIVDVITSDRHRWIETMLREEHGYGERGLPAWKAGLITFVAFLLIGAVPLLTFVINFFSPGTFAKPFFICSVLTGAAFAAVGALKGRIVQQNMVVAAAETLLMGGLAAAIAYAVGAMLKGMVGI